MQFNGIGLFFEYKFQMLIQKNMLVAFDEIPLNVFRNVTFRAVKMFRPANIVVPFEFYIHTMSAAQAR